MLERCRPEHSRRFAISPAEGTPAWRVVRRGTDLERKCSFYYEATVLNDNTVRPAGLLIDVPPGPRKRSYAGARIELRQLLDASWRVYLRDSVIATAAATTAGELRALRRHRRRLPSAVSVGGPLQSPSGLFSPPHPLRRDSVPNRMNGGRTEPLSSDTAVAAA